MRATTLLCFLALASSGNADEVMRAAELGVGSTATAPMVTLPDGTVLRGEASADTESFRGVRFAAPPTGSLRWASPQPWSYGDTAGQEVDAAEFGPVCPQENCDPVTGCDEDCLFLNVFRLAPGANASSSLPVAVWIHGGTYVSGASNDVSAHVLMVLHSEREINTVLHLFECYGDVLPYSPRVLPVLHVLCERNSMTAATS